jgi:hypothetical protein
MDILHCARGAVATGLAIRPADTIRAQPISEVPRMSIQFDSFQELYDAEGQPLGAFLGPRPGPCAEAVLARYAQPAPPPEASSPSRTGATLSSSGTLNTLWTTMWPARFAATAQAPGAGRAPQVRAHRRQPGRPCGLPLPWLRGQILKRHFKDSIRSKPDPSSRRSLPEPWARQVSPQRYSRTLLRTTPAPGPCTPPPRWSGCRR